VPGYACRVTPADDIEVRAASAADAETIAGFNARLASETEAIVLEAHRLRDGVAALLADPAKGFYTVAEAAGRVVGQMLVTYEWSDWRNGWFWWVQSVYVDPEYRGQGVFARIYRHVEERARASGEVCGVRLYVEEGNEAARTVYRRLGLQDAPYRMLQVDWTLDGREP